MVEWIRLQGGDRPELLDTLPRPRLELPEDERELRRARVEELV